MGEDAKYLGPLQGVRPAETNSTFPEGACRALIASEDMTVDIENDNGLEVLGVPLNRGINPIRAKKLLDFTGDSVFVGF